MKTSLGLFGLLVLLAVFATTSRDAAGQFTQGPPGNPSAAGIITGTQPPVPAPPRVIAPPSPPSPAYVPVPYPGAVSYPVSDVCPLGAGMILSPHWLLSSQGMPTALDSQMVALARQLTLSSDQLDGIFELRDRFYRETRELRYELLQKRTELRKLLSDPKADEKALLQRQREVSALWHKLADILGQAVIEARRLLTPEQIERLDQLPL